MANLNASFSELRQALQAVDDTWAQLAAQNAIHSWPHGANPGQLLKGAMVALQNGIIGIVAPSQDASGIRVLTGLHDVAVSFEEASEGKLSKVAQLALSADGMSAQALADSVTGEKRFILPDFGGPGKCVLLNFKPLLFPTPYFYFSLPHRVVVSTPRPQMCLKSLGLWCLLCCRRPKSVRRLF